MMRPGLAILIAVVAALLPPLAAVAAPPEEYRAALGQTLHAAQAAMAIKPALASLAEHPPLAAVLPMLAAIHEVDVVAGEPVAVDNSRLIARLRGNRDEGHRALDDLAALVAAMEASATAADRPAAERARAALDSVLAKPEFRALAGDPLTRLLAELRAQLVRRLDDALAGINLTLPFAVPLGQAVALLLIALLLSGAVVGLVFSGLAWRSGRHNLARHAVLPVGGRVREVEDARAARLAALAAADAADYRGAVRYLYLWAVLHLAETSRLRFDRSLTNHEHLRAWRGGGEIESSLRSAVSAFDRIWYGHSECGQAEFQNLRGIVERIVEARP